MIKLDLSEKEKQKLTDDEIEIAKARKLEILILPYLKRNINFFYAGANIPKKAKAYHKPLDAKDLEETLEKRKEAIATVCMPLCKMVAEILKENGINAEPITCDTDMFRHTDVLITTKTGKKYIINYLEDMENIQTGMKTPDFASQKYYERRYKKFENGQTPDGKNLENISFLSEDELGKIDEQLGYKKYGMYMDQVIEQIQSEFKDYRNIMAENEYINEIFGIEQSLTEEEKNKIREKIQKKYAEMSDDEILEGKLDWIFNYFNERMDISGHTDFVMYYSRLLLKQVLSSEEYDKIKRYDCFVNKKKISQDCIINNVLDYGKNEEETRMRFCLLETGENVYAFSTKPKCYKKITLNDVEDLKKYANIAESKRPSDLVLKLCDKGNALPLVFHPLGSEILNQRAEMIDLNLSEEQKEEELDKLVASIKATDGAVTSITIPYPDGSQRYLYITPNNEFAIKEKGDTVIYHYDEENDIFNKESLRGEER